MDDINRYIYSISGFDGRIIIIIGYYITFFITNLTLVWEKYPENTFCINFLVFVYTGMKIVGIGNDSNALANKKTKNSTVVGNSDIYVLYIATLFETIIFRPRFHSPHTPPRFYRPTKIEREKWKTSITGPFTRSQLFKLRRHIIYSWPTIRWWHRVGIYCRTYHGKYRKKTLQKN